MSRNTEATDDVKTWTGNLNYKEGFFTRLTTDELAKGINEDVVRAISPNVTSRNGCWSFA
jgi:Fe-S cluster assembly protein SufB